LRPFQAINSMVINSLVPTASEKWRTWTCIRPWGLRSS